ncbi:chemotaxis protein CheB [Symbioplanes lichenis]|uniref:chemotaxis protein CheB n=1 Tax=Symbioplanes lichenis TaxID=1629072 RepID=UPI00273A3698|nr:chemotaxis protein CheB [Actinoplanes lichenis]
MAAREGAAAAGTEVVALVASAGGLGALTAVLRTLPADFPAAIVIGQHLSGRGSVLVEILSRQIALPVGWARPGGPVTPGHVTVCPPRSRVEVLPDRTCAVTPTGAARDDRPLDALLVSVAESVGASAAGVVLTGMGSDGARGAAVLREAGGLVIAQSEDTAEHPSMPQAAVAAGAVDLVLPLYDIGLALVDAALGRRLPVPPTEAQAVRSVFGSDGVMASIAADLDWSRVSLGPVSGWSPVLRTMVRLVMACPDPAVVLWGEDLLYFTNDAGIPLIRGRERDTFARPYLETFADMHDQIVPALRHVMRGIPARYPTMPFRYPRDGRMQDVWADMTDTPIRELDGTVAGVHRQFFDRTAEVLAARRLAVLNRLGGLRRAGDRRAAITGALEVLSQAPDVPFAVGYVLDPPGIRARLVAAAGVEAGGPMAPREVKMVRDGGWPLREAAGSGRPVVVGDVGARFRGQLVADRRIAPEAALVHPLLDDADDQVVGLLVLGADPYLSLDEDYRRFLGLVADSIAARMAKAHAGRRERERLERLAELDRAKTEFFSNVSHEFRTPLTLMLEPLDAALEHAGGLPATLVTELQVARRNARRLLRLTGSLLDFAQMEAGRLRARPVPVDLAGRTREIVQQFDGVVTRAGLRLRTAIEPIGEPVWADTEMWEKIVANLLSNAVKFTFAGEIEVALRALPKHAELTVRDTGAGIPEEELPHIFKRFHQVRDTRARTHEGAGIGLALVEELVRRHHGRVRATSVPGAGTTFTVWLPLGRRPAHADDEPPPAPTGAGVAAVMAEEAERWIAGSPGVETPDTAPWDGADAGDGPHHYAPGARILVVEDNRDLRDYLGRLLGAAWTVRLAGNGRQALELIRSERPDLVLSDVMMPELDGSTLLTAVRTDRELASTPVVLLTARAGEAAAVDGLLAGADDYIVKPFSARELVARVGGQLELTRVRRRQAQLDAFRVALTDTLRSIPDPVEVQARAAELLGRQLGAGRAYYQEFDRVAGTFTVHRNYTDGLPSLAGTYPLADYGDDLVRETLETGRPLVVRDSAALPPASAASWAGLSVRAGVAAPNFRGGVCVAALGITSAEPRDWTDEEIALVEETADRTWAFVERVRAETELRESDERFRTAADTVPALIWHNDAAGDNVFVNRFYRDYTGLTDDQVSGARWQTLLHPDDAAASIAGYLGAVRDRTAWRDRTRVRRHDGHWQTFDHYASPLFGADGTYLGHIGVSLASERD